MHDLSCTMIAEGYVPTYNGSIYYPNTQQKISPKDFARKQESKVATRWWNDKTGYGWYYDEYQSSGPSDAAVYIDSVYYWYNTVNGNLDRICFYPYYRHTQHLNGVGYKAREDETNIKKWDITGWNLGQSTTQYLPGTKKNAVQTIDTKTTGWGKTRETSLDNTWISQKDFENTPWYYQKEWSSDIWKGEAYDNGSYLHIYFYAAPSVTGNIKTSGLYEGRQDTKISSATGSVTNSNIEVTIKHGGQAETFDVYITKSERYCCVDFNK